MVQVSTYIAIVRDPRQVLNDNERFKLSLMKNLVSYCILRCEWDIIFTMLTLLRSIYRLLRKMTLPNLKKKKKRFSSIVTYKGLKSTPTSIQSLLTLSRRWAQVPPQSHTSLWRVGAKLLWTWVTTAPQVAVTILCQLFCGHAAPDQWLYQKKKKNKKNLISLHRVIPDTFPLFEEKVLKNTH